MYIAKKFLKTSNISKFVCFARPHILISVVTICTKILWEMQLEIAKYTFNQHNCYVSIESLYILVIAKTPKDVAIGT